MPDARPIPSASVDEFQSYADRLNKGDPWKRRLHIQDRGQGGRLQISLSRPLQLSGDDLMPIASHRCEREGRDAAEVMDEEDREWVDLEDRREEPLQDVQGEPICNVAFIVAFIVLNMIYL